MENIFKRMGAIAVLLLFIGVIPSISKSDAVLSYNDSSIVSGKMPCIQYDNTTNFDPYWITNLNQYKDKAYMNLTSVWSQDIYVDDLGNVYWVDNYGYVMSLLNGFLYYIGSPYPYNFSFAGPIVSMAVINDIYVWYVALLTEYGYVFVYNMNTNAWFNATNVWGLTLQNVWSQYKSPWTSVTSNVLGDQNNYNELFIFTNLNGEVYAFDTTYNATGGINYGGWWNNNPTQYRIISTTAYYDEENKNSGHLFGISFNGIVYRFNNGWRILKNSGINGVVGITIGKSTDLPKRNTYFRDGNTIFIIQIYNGTKLYEYNSRSGNFQVYGSIFTGKGTNQAVSFDLYDSFNNINTWYILQTNGTIAYSNNNHDASSWGYLNNYLFMHNTGDTLNIISGCPLDFTGSLYYVSSQNIWNMYNLTVYLTGSDGYLKNEFYYSWILGQYNNPANPAILQHYRYIYLNFTYMPNMAYNSTFNFNLILNSQSNAVILVYYLKINVINHFPYIPI
ncbi:MAG: hypothetical protein F9Y92_07225 [Thermoplasmatales archaeon]|nr:hypothetical protein [Thermoplasmatales archaeon]